MVLFFFFTCFILIPGVETDAKHFVNWSSLGAYLECFQLSKHLGVFNPILCIYIPWQ